MSLKHSSATGVKQTRCCCCCLCARPPCPLVTSSHSAYQTCSCGKSRQLSDERMLSEQHQRFVIVRLSSSLSLASLVAPRPRSREWEDTTFKRFRVSSYPVHVHVQHCPARSKPKPVWPINTSITTQLLTVPPDTDFLGGPVFRLRLLVKFSIYLSFN